MTKINRFSAGIAPRGTRRSRGGFSLTELLVVMAIMAILAALITAGIQRSRDSQIRKNSEATVAKVQNGVDLHIKAITDQVAVDKNRQTAEFGAMLAYCDGDTLRATSLLTHCRVKQAFPQTAADVATPAGFTVAGVNFPRSPVFAQFQGITGDPNHISAALLYAALNRSIQGTTFGADEVTQGEIALGTPHKVFMDGWGRPIAFVRWHRSAELNGPEYANPNDPNKNPFDPKGKLASWAPTPATKKTDAANVLGGAPGFFTNDNSPLVVYSGGPNQRYDNLINDDILGYKVRAGKKGGP